MPTVEAPVLLPSGMDYSDKNRWLVLILFSIFSFTNAVQWVTYAPIANDVKDFFGLSTYQLNMLSMVYMIVFVVGAFFTCTTFERWGVRKGVLIGSGLNALGSLLKFAPGLQHPGYTLLIVPQTINSFAQLFVLSTPPLIAAQYFPAHKRAFATAVAATANSLGNACALLVPPLVVREPKKEQFQVLFGCEMGLCCSIFVACIFFLKAPQYSAPSAELLASATAAPLPLPSSAGSPTGKAALTVGPSTIDDASQTEDSEVHRQYGCCGTLLHGEQAMVFVQVFDTCKTLLSNWNFVFLLVAFSIGMGSVWTFASVLAQIMDPFGVSEVLAGIAGAGNIVVGTVMAYIVGTWVDHHRRYKIPVIVCLSGSVITCSAYIVVMAKASPNTTSMDALTVFIYVFAGIFQNTAIPICFEFAMEITYPLPESVPGALLMAGANFTALIMVVVASAILGDDDTTKSNAILIVVVVVVLSVVGTIFSCLPREHLKRREAECIARDDELQRLTDPHDEGEEPLE